MVRRIQCCKHCHERYTCFTTRTNNDCPSCRHSKHSKQQLESNNNVGRENHRDGIVGGNFAEDPKGTCPPNNDEHVVDPHDQGKPLNTSQKDGVSKESNNDTPPLTRTLDPSSGELGGVDVSNQDMKKKNPTVADNYGSHHHPIATKKQKTDSSQDNNNVCFICGTSLEKITSSKNRVLHMKRCAKKHGVQARFMKQNDDEHEHLVRDETKDTSTTNPYNNTTEWHGTANQDLELADNNNTCTPCLQGKQPILSNCFQAPMRSLNKVLLAGAKCVAKTKAVVENNKSNKKKRPWNYTSFANKTCPSYKRIPGTDFICDGFMYAKSSLTRKYFLTHFHSDHYGGISSGWSAGIIYCSLPTANLVHAKLGVDKKYLHPLGLYTPTVIESHGKPVVVTLMDANHCPGAVMFLFQVGQRFILHVGDFRWNRQSMLETGKFLRSFYTQQQRLDDLFLDTTYCDEKYTLPTQEQAIQATMDIMKKELESKRKTLFLFGAYTIGKERIYLAVAERFQRKVYVDKQRLRTLSALNLHSNQMSLLTTDKNETNLRVVPLGHVNFKHMQTYLDQVMSSTKVFDSKKYDGIVGFRPTGWSHTGKKSKTSSIVNSRSNGILTVHGVPYSEHSSFPELVDCIACLKPKRIVPTVSVSKSEQQVNLLLGALKRREMFKKHFENSN